MAHDTDQAGIAVAGLHTRGCEGNGKSKQGIKEAWQSNNRNDGSGNDETKE